MKILFENKQLNEGPGAGYTVSGTLTNVKVNAIKNIKEVERTDLVEYEVELDATADFDDVSANSYYYGGTVESTPVSIERIRVEFSDGEDLTTDDIRWAIDGTKVEATLGGGWSHSKFEGIIDVDYRSLDNTSLTAILFKLTDERAITYLDKAVQNENTETQYGVVENHWVEAAFDTAEEAIQFAKENGYENVQELYVLIDINGDEIDTEFGDIVWTNDDMEESLKEGTNNSWTHFSFESGANPYIAKTDKEAKRIIKKYGDKVKKINDNEYVIDDKEEKDLFSVNEDITDDTNDTLSSGSAKEMSNVIFDTLFNNTQYPQFDFNKVENQEVDANKGQIVFDYMGHEYRITIEELSGQFTESTQKPLTESFDDEDRINALAEFLNIDPSEISNIYDYEYETPEGDYLVVDEDEATELAKEDIRNLYDDMGLESFTSGFRDWIIMNALDNDWFEDAIRESYEFYVEDIESESSSMGYDNRLIEEMHDHQVLSDEDFEIDEDGEPNLRELKEGIDIDDKKEEFIDLLVENAGNAVDYCGDNFGWDWVTKMATQNNLIDLEEVVNQCIYDDGIAHFIARYDGQEHDLGNGLYAYRTN